MSAFLVRRLAASAVLLVLVLSATFALFALVPGEATDRWNDPRIPAAERERAEALWGLDRPAHEQFTGWWRRLLAGDLGWSHSEARPVSTVIRERAPQTLLLAVGAGLVAVLLGTLVAVLGASRPGSTIDRLLGATSMLLWSTPGFWFALLVVLLFSHRLDLFPPSGVTSLAPPAGSLGALLDRLHHLALPALVLATPMAVEISRFLRSALLQQKRSDWWRAGRARGLSTRLLWRHGLRQAYAPLLHVVALRVGQWTAGAVIVESIFAWPGLGRALLAAASSQDWELVLALTALTGTAVIILGLLADIAQAALDPRVRLEEAKP